MFIIMVIISLVINKAISILVSATVKSILLEYNSYNSRMLLNYGIGEAS